MLTSELQTSKDAHPSHGHSPHARAFDPDSLIEQLRATLPIKGGNWRIVSFKTLLPVKDDKIEQATPEPQPPKKKDAPSPDSAPIKPGAPRIEVAYEWHKDCSDS